MVTLDWEKSTLDWEMATLDWEMVTLDWEKSTLDWEMATLDWEKSTLDWEMATLDWEKSTLDWEMATLDWEMTTLDWERSTLDWADLPWADLTWTDLPSTDLPSTELPSTELPSTELPSTDLTLTDLTLTDLPSTDLPSTDLTSTDLTSTDLLSTDLTLTDLTRTDLTWADLTCTDQYEFIYRFVAEMFQKELARGLHDHQNLAKEPRASHSQHLSQPPLSKPLISPKPLSASSLPELGPRPPAAKSMPREGPANETYAAVARTKTGAGGVLVPPKASPPPARPAVGCAYENLAPVGQPALEALLYSTVIVKDMPRPAKPRSHPEAPPKAKETHSSPAAISYAMIDFGPAGLDPQGSPATSSDVASEYWAPTLPERTADSYVVLDADESGASSYSSNHENNKRSSNLSNVFKLGHPGNAARNASVATDDSYEDVSGASSPVVSRFSSSNGLGFNSRVSKPKGPRPCPEAWALYGQ
ncbi:uncharacterized protein LOC121274179 [Carcharodon carcharias]|uniref:uncharacterized protein LOC121274179 n=1 Tax=Carcharodon carcharias TaxID=13397 RepID=UPI001B7E3D15|nr:uncharacterized protein LOC121274179 [Carcharodon carcharias]